MSDEARIWIKHHRQEYIAKFGEVNGIRKLYGDAYVLFVKKAS